MIVMIMVMVVVIRIVLQGYYKLQTTVSVECNTNLIIQCNM
jgi:hypothetical protein